MHEPPWIEYSASNVDTQSDVRSLLSKLSIEFVAPNAKIIDNVFHLPTKGSIFVLADDAFVLKVKEQREKFDEGYWTGPEAYGSRWVPSNAVDNDDLWGLGPKVRVSAGYITIDKYWHGGIKDGQLFLNEVKREQAQSIVATE